MTSLDSRAPEIDTGLGVLSFDGFLQLLYDELGHDVRGAHPGTDLRDDLGWDSLALFELIGLFDRYAIDLPDDALPSLRTLGDVHHYVGVLSGQGSPPPERWPSSRPVLRAPTHHDHDYLFQLHVTGEPLVRFRLRAMTPSPEAFHRLLWDGVLAQFVVSTEGGDPVGLVSCLGADLRNRHAHLAVLADPAWRGTGLLVAGAWQFIGYLFAHFDLRKLYAEVLSSNFRRLRTGAGRLFVVEGRLSAHEFVDGGYEDLYLLALDRERWVAQSQRLTAEPSAGCGP